MKEDKPHTKCSIKSYAPIYGAFSIFTREADMKNRLHHVFLTVGLGTLIFVPMLIIDNGLNDSMKSVLIWLGASVLYGLSFIILELKTIFRIPLHFAACFAITFAVRLGYNYLMNGEVRLKKLFMVTLPVFIVIYAVLLLYMRYFGNIELLRKSDE